MNPRIVSTESSHYAYCAVLQYDGRNYYGWQRLREHPTLQAAVELAIERSFAQRVLVVGAGRTDRGAHAEGQVVGFRLTEQHAAAAVAETLNRQLPDDIRVTECRDVPASFHARNSAIGKIYEYRIITTPQLPSAKAGRVWHLPGQLDVMLMRQAARALVGRRDFASFATKSRLARGSSIRHLQQATIDEHGSEIVLQFCADSFLYHMVRNIVRALVKVGQGRVAPDRIAGILTAGDRAASPGSAPASGLYLMQVIY